MVFVNYNYNMNILFITNFHQLYGANRSLLSVAEYFKEKGENVCVLLPKEGDFSKKLKDEGMNYIVIPYFSQLFYYKKTKRYFAAPFLGLATLCILPFIIYKIKKIHPNLIYSNCSAENIGIFIAKALSVKHISHIREFMDLDLERHFIFGKKAKRNFIKRSDGVIYVTYAVANHVLMGQKLPPNHRVIYNGVQMPKTSFRERDISTQINFGIVGLLDKGKGQDIAILYFNEIKSIYPKSILHIWGDREGTFKKDLHQLVERLDLLDRVVFHGFEKNTDIIYNDIHILLMCSKSEGFGRVTIEAMSRGIPVIGYRGGGTIELVKEGVNGFLFTNKADFVHVVNSLLESQDRYNEISHNAYVDAHMNYQEKKYTNLVHKFINEIIRNNE